MPKVGGKHYPYTPAGKRAAQAERIRLIGKKKPKAKKKVGKRYA